MQNTERPSSSAATVIKSGPECHAADRFLHHSLRCILHRQRRKVAENVMTIAGHLAVKILLIANGAMLVGLSVSEGSRSTPHGECEVFRRIDEFWRSLANKHGEFGISNAAQLLRYE
jgi:hypothetical protein